MFGTQIRRLIHQTCNKASSKKTNLVKLRKKTGFAFANCKKALEVCDNNVSQAEQWLKDQAQVIGWAKASEVQDRLAAEGLVALAIEKNHAAIIEVNCETEFVTRNKKFQSLVELVANSCLSFCKKQDSPEKSFSKVCLEADSLKRLEGSDGKSLADHTAVVIGLVGENLQLRRATCIVVDKKMRLAGFIHPASKLDSSPLLGEYGSIIVFNSSKSSKNLQDITRQLCQHIIGMNPSKIGSMVEDSPSEDINNESIMIYQEFLFNPEVTIQQILDINNLDIVDFVRYACGESSCAKNNDLMNKESVS